MQATFSAGQQCVTWNPNNRKQVDEAKLKYIEARKELRVIEPESFDAQSGAFVIKESLLKSYEVMVRLVNEIGDERIIWNMLDPKQTKEASERFQKYLDKGWKAYAVKSDGSKSLRINSFDPECEEILFDDTREKLKDFSSKFKKIEILPRTYPG